MVEPPQRPPVLALTGGIASGKSTVAQVLVELGAEVIDADRLARDAVAADTEGQAEVVEAFGGEVLRSDGELDRPRLGAIVFQDPGARARLEAIVHPRVAELSRTAIAHAVEAGAELVVYEIPLLFEIGREADFDGSILVYLEPELQLRRLMERSGLDLTSAQARMASQMPVAEKLPRATWVVDNSGSRADTRTRVFGLWPELVRRRT